MKNFKKITETSYAHIKTSLCFILGIIFLMLLATGCSNNPTDQQDEQQENKPTPSSFGLVEVTLSGIGTNKMKASAQPARPDGAAKLTQLSGDGTIQLEPVSNGSFTHGERGNGGQRYIYATFKVRNADVDGNAYSDARQNLTFLSVDTDASANTTETIGVTAVSALRLFDGTELSGATAEDIAEATIPTGQVAQNGSSEVIPTSPDVLQVFTESEVSEVSVPTGVEAFPYGFVTRSLNVTPGSRTLPASPAAGEFDGVVTFSFKMPLQSSAGEDPFEVNMMFLPVDDDNTRITQSPEEQTDDGNAALTDRETELNPDEITILPGSTYRNSATLRCDPVRVTGAQGSPEATLFPTPPSFTSLAPDPYDLNGSASHISASTDFTATYESAVSGADARSFVVRGKQSGVQFLGQSYTGNDTKTVSSPSGSFFPGEQVELSLTPAVGPCPGRTARYRVEITTGSGNLHSVETFEVGSTPYSVALGDLDGDGELDIVVANRFSENVSVILSKEGFLVVTNFDAGVGPKSVALGDLDGDGDLDIVVANEDSDNVSVLLGDGSGGIGTATNFGADDGPQSVALGDLDGDGDLDIVVANRSSDNVSVLLGNGSGEFAVATNFGAGDDPSSVALGDLDSDGVLDIAVANKTSDNMSILTGDGSGSFNAAANFAAGRNPASVALGDLNGDGALDIAVANEGSDNVSVLLGDGSGGVGTATNFDAGGDPRSVALGDLDGDGDLDIATANRDADNVGVLLGTGSGEFGAATNFDVDPFLTGFKGPVSVALGTGRDGALEVFTANEATDDVTVLLDDN